MQAELLEILGDDRMIVNAARVSYGKTVAEFGEKDAKLIKYLIEHDHHSPLRHPQLQFRITCPIYVERQLFKHQVGVTNNSISGRYVDFSDSYYEIKEYRKQSKSSKQGSEGVLDESMNDMAVRLVKRATQECKKVYDYLIAMGVSKEQARGVLPLSLNTTYISTMSLAAFIHMCKLRLKPDTQQETRELVQMMLDQVKESGQFNHTLEAVGL